MRPSQLQLKHYSLERIHIEPVKGYKDQESDHYPNIEDADFSSAIQVGNAVNGDRSDLTAVRLTLRCVPREGASFPYEIEVTVAGVFDGAALPDADREMLTLVNGASLLYGVLRDEVLRLTTRMVNGAVMFPTANFQDVVEEQLQDLPNSPDNDQKLVAKRKPRAPKTH